MAHFIVVCGGLSLLGSGVFGEIAQGQVPGADYVPEERFFHGHSRVFRYLLGGKLRKHTDKCAPLRIAVAPLQRAARALRRLPVRKRLRALLSATEENYLIFAPLLNSEWLTPRLPRRLRRVRGCDRLVLYLIDSAQSIASKLGASQADMTALFDSYDAAFTYNAADAAAYGAHLRHVDIPLWRAPAAAPEVPGSDVYFCGLEKDRAELIADLQDYFAATGVRAHLHVVHWQALPQLHPRLNYCRPLPYQETIPALLDTNCVLELISGDAEEPTLRYKEAVLYGKKLLTNNPKAPTLPYFDPRWMRVFRVPEDIDPDWLRAVEPVDYGYRGDYSAQNFLRRVQKLTPRA